MPEHKPDFTKCPFCHGDANTFVGGNDACECHGTGLMELEPGVGARRLAIDVERSIVGVTYAPIDELPEANTFRIHHHYHMGDQGVTIQAPQDLDIKRAAVYIQFQAENLFGGVGDDVTVSNQGIAAALVSFYGCKHIPHSRYATDLDMYSEREKLCPKYKELMADATLMREGLNEFLKEHLDA